MLVQLVCGEFMPLTEGNIPPGRKHFWGYRCIVRILGHGDAAYAADSLWLFPLTPSFILSRPETLPCPSLNRSDAVLETEPHGHPRLAQTKVLIPDDRGKPISVIFRCFLMGGFPTTDIQNVLLLHT